MKNNYRYFKNTECEYFPCHKIDGETFNCLFCYCPLYALGAECGGNLVYTEGGKKDCSNCLIPHGANGYSYIVTKFSEASERAKKNETK